MSERQPAHRLAFYSGLACRPAHFLLYFGGRSFPRDSNSGWGLACRPADMVLPFLWSFSRDSNPGSGDSRRSLWWFGCFSCFCRLFLSNICINAFACCATGLDAVQRFEENKFNPGWGDWRRSFYVLRVCCGFCLVLWAILCDLLFTRMGLIPCSRAALGTKNCLYFALLWRRTSFWLGG